ncbi:hypothetical protein CI610_03128 [invertebrate metagenome]|uniref:Protein kinase domain-containing protein n=1 Tax=invertebrate metagenome TaxID=1711999 RepID=A0A2H9T405_9ZZZZ
MGDFGRSVKQGCKSCQAMIKEKKICYGSSDYYMDPRIRQNNKLDPDKEMDIWSLGVLLFIVFDFHKEIKDTFDRWSKAERSMLFKWFGENDHTSFEWFCLYTAVDNKVLYQWINTFKCYFDSTLIKNSWDLILRTIHPKPEQRPSADELLNKITWRFVPLRTDAF